MIDQAQAIWALEGTVALGLVAILVYGPWQRFCTDYARQHMFAERDALFDMASNGELDFADPDYQVMRASINDMIRFAHNMTWTRILVLRFGTDRPKDWKPPVYHAVAGINKRDVRQRVRKIVAGVEFWAALMVFARSPLLILLCVGTVLPMVAGVVAFFAAKDFLRTAAIELGQVIQREAALVRS